MEELIDAAEIEQRILKVIVDRQVKGIPAPEPQSAFFLDGKEFEAIPTFPWRMASLRSGGTLLPIKERSRCDLRELLSFDGVVFVANCYRVLLGRDPDADGLQMLLSRLESGRPKILVLARIRYSKEGRRSGIRVPGLMGLALAAGVLELVRKGPRPLVRRGIRVLKRFI